MTIKKLTVAAAFAVSIATCISNGALAECPCHKSVSPATTSWEAPVNNCSKCHRALSECECNKKAAEPCCEKAQVPTCANCATPERLTSAGMKQVYAYPNAIYGGNTIIGNESDMFVTIDSAFAGNNMAALSPNIAGSSVISGQTTGAAAPILNENNLGVMLQRENNIQSSECPIDISTANSLQAVKKSYVPFEFATGGAANLDSCEFPDVPNSLWAACDIDKLAINDVVVGYPDGLYKPKRNVSRAEFATMLVKGFGMENCGLAPQKLFSDVPTHSWANPTIAKAVQENLMKGYPNNTFKPNKSVTRAEALTAIAKGIPCDIDECKANEILNQYQDSSKIADWARIPIAKSIDSGALKDFPNKNMIMPNKEASRAEVASMLQTVRVAAGYDKNPATANVDCPVCPKESTAYVENTEMVSVPTLKLEMMDQLNAKSAHINQIFRAKTLEDVTINGQVFPCGSIVSGKVVEVIRPSGCQKGALKLAFTKIKNGDCEATLPKQILTAQINKSRGVNPVAKLVSMPFAWGGSLLGVVGRTTGGAISALGNAAENVSNGVGLTFSNTLQGKLPAAGRSLGDSIYQTAKAPIDLTRTAVSGTMGLFQTTGDELAYLVDPAGHRISTVNPREHFTIAFGCNE